MANITYKISNPSDKVFYTNHFSYSIVLYDFLVLQFLLVIYNHGDISIPSFIRYHLTIARFS
ncbi:hypothetical protein AZK33_10855, partial [Streptococcus pneumoniae]